MESERPDQRLADIGHRLRQRRQELGLTQDQLAERLGHLNVVSVSMYERGQREPRILTFLRLAEALEIDPAELLGPGRSPNPEPHAGRSMAVARKLRELANELDGESAG